jgi:hypothetical protein
MHVNRCCKSRRHKFDIERSRENFNIYRPYNRNASHAERGGKSPIMGRFFELLLNIGKSRKTFQNYNMTLFD